ncbi:uncharacterized protein PV06_04748 [Exophiala oligosperma]|uniref:Zn(2)-C6 fungal-type domain-containing protein n=1 Tax=Exophiala oligosperma TaxID=215243 RepID=A0A0D2E769_9EURO|nr:uncharacterized protein PV06_04748 [Exophiala oligosperma]KIW43669.1 hypothetical protein PV06_04748 [Exophiala oligosperma]
MSTSPTTCPRSSVGDTTISRKRKIHRKSRLGCRNCKLRRIKCDEQRPMCEKCISFGVTCNYNSLIPDLQPIAGTADKSGSDQTSDERLISTCFSANEQVLNMVNIYLNIDLDGDGALQKDLTRNDMDRLHRFQARTITTMGTKSTARLYRKEMIHLAFNHRYLMHLVQYMTALHDRFLAGKAIAKQTPDENYHMAQGLRGLQTKLNNPLRAEDRDALFVSASLIGVITFFYIEADSMHDVWPLVDSDLSWVSLSDGKKAIWRATNPLRTDSIWRPIAEIYERDLMSAQSVTPEHVLSPFDHLCSEKDDSIEALINPYHKTAKFLISLLGLEMNDSTWIRFLAFICHVDPPFKRLLEVKDPWALMILAYWFMKICRGAWWASTRAVVQGQAICLYLERYHSDDQDLQKAIPLVKKELETAQKEGWGGIEDVLYFGPEYVQHVKPAGAV